MDVIVRPAVEGDGATIKALAHSESVNPYNLPWSRFLVAEDEGVIVGIQQVRVHKGGTREVATRVVRPEFRRRGIGTGLLLAAFDRETGPLYVQCGHQWTRYYERFGFRQVKVSELPPDLRGQHRLARMFVALRSIWVRRRLRLSAMKRDATRQSWVAPIQERPD